MGFGFQGKCYPDGAAVLEGLKTSFPHVDTYGVVYISGQPSIVEATGTVSMTTVSKSIQGTLVSTTRTSTILLATCTESAEAAGGVGLSPAEYELFQNLITQANAPYDYVNGGAIFGSVLVATLALYLLVRSVMEFYKVVTTGARRI